MVGEKTEDKAVGRTRGGLNTKLHAIVDGLGNPVEFLLSAGNDNDCVHAVELLENVELCGSNVLADRAYGAQSIREYISEHGANYVIPPQSNVSNPWPVDWYPAVGLPYCAGYACGYHLVKHYLKKTGKSIVEATLLPASEILEVAEDFWNE